MDQDEYAVFLRALTTLVIKLDERFGAQEEFNRQQVAVNDRMATGFERVTVAIASVGLAVERIDVAIERIDMAVERIDAAIERLDVTLAAIKDMLGRGDGH
jgi:hypothetical protein